MKRQFIRVVSEKGGYGQSKRVFLVEVSENDGHETATELFIVERVDIRVDYDKIEATILIPGHFVEANLKPKQ